MNAKTLVDRMLEDMSPNGITAGGITSGGGGGTGPFDGPASGGPSPVVDSGKKVKRPATEEKREVQIGREILDMCGNSTHLADIAELASELIALHTEQQPDYIPKSLMTTNPHKDQWRNR